MNYAMPVFHWRDNAAVKSCRLLQQSKSCDVHFWGWATRSDMLESWSQIVLQGHAFPLEFHRMSFFCVPSGISSSVFFEYS